MSDGPDAPPEADAPADPDAPPENETAADPDAEPTENNAPDRPMSTDTIDATAATDQPDDRGEGDDAGTDTGVDLVRYARYALLGGLTLLALVATLRFYFAASNAIDIWVARQYRPLFQAAFNLVVLLVAAVGISWEIRKVTG